MEDWLIVEDKTVQEALTQALIKLELTSDQVEYEVLEEEKGGLLGLFSKPAKIRVRKKGSESQKTATETPSEKKEAAPAEAVVEEPVAPVEPAPAAPEPKPEKPSREVTRDISKITVQPFLTELFKAMDLQVEVTEEYNSEEQQIEVDLSGPEMGMLIGKRGQTLDALQYLSSLVLNKDYDDYVKVKLDTENYRDRRKATIENLAKNVAKKVKASGRPSTLEPMNPYERRIIHAALQDDKYVNTHSEGEEPHRKVVVTVNPEFADELKEKNRNSRDRRGGYNRGGRGGNRGRGGYNRNRKPYNRDRQKSE
ncbi:MAG: protein jag [Eubacterium sp.]|nr:protein jag [Eubacterium sp.]